MATRIARGLRLLPTLLLAIVAGAQPAPDPGASGLLALAPYLAHIVRLAGVDPVLASSLVPDAWIDSLLAGAFRVDAETASVPPHADPPREWPIGPWAGPASLIDTLEATDPRDVAALYRATAPRIGARCRTRGASPPACEAALRRAGARLGARAVLDRAAGEGAPAVTPTQRELARLGPPVVASLRGRIHQVGSALWGGSWHSPAAS